jgi:hypothetical protein
MSGCGPDSEVAECADDFRFMGTPDSLCSPRAFPSLTDAVEKGMCWSLEATLIQDWKAMRVLDSKIQLPGFVCFKFQFPIFFADTFSTVSTQFRHCRCRDRSAH